MPCPEEYVRILISSNLFRLGVVWLKVMKGLRGFAAEAQGLLVDSIGGIFRVGLALWCGNGGGWETKIWSRFGNGGILWIIRRASLLQ